MRLRPPARTLAVLMIATGACKAAPTVTQVSGPCADVYHAQVCSWARMQGSTVLAVGVSVPLMAIDSAADHGPMTFPPAAAAVVELPEPAQQQSGLTHLTMYWEEHGHPPAPYMVPHFDFHFYSIPSPQRAAIDCSNTAKPPALATGYALPDESLPPDLAKMIGVPVLVGICVPQMGMHSLLASELESTTPFRGTMVLGYYDGKPIFIEPMISRAMLQEKQSFDLPIPAVPGLSGSHPATFRAEYDAQQGVYNFVFSGFQTGT